VRLVHRCKLLLISSFSFIDLSLMVTFTSIALVQIHQLLILNSLHLILSKTIMISTYLSELSNIFLFLSFGSLSFGCRVIVFDYYSSGTILTQLHSLSQIVLRRRILSHLIIRISLSFLENIKIPKCIIELKFVFRCHVKSSSYQYRQVASI
jgi:hypothetical protein